MKVLIVEDQKYPLESLEWAVKKFFASYSIAKSYNQASELIERDEFDVVFLDNRMPLEDQGDLEERDMRKFSESLENIGYTLIPMIKSRNPKVIVIGTSSMSKNELNGMPFPDYKMSKMWGDAERDLEAILRKENILR